MNATPDRKEEERVGKESSSPHQSPRPSVRSSFAHFLSTKGLFNLHKDGNKIKRDFTCCISKTI